MLPRSLQIFRKYGCRIYSLRNLKFHTNTSPALYPRFDKDLPNPNLPESASKLYGPDTDILLDQLRKCKTLDKLLELINTHLEVMNSKHVVSCLENINQFIKGNDPGTQNLLENPSFKLLCTRLMKVVQLLEPQEVITAYKVLTSLNLRSNTYVMQALLKMLGSHLNNMNLGQLVFVNFILHKQRHNALVEGLKLAIPLVLQVQIDQQISSNNLTEVVNCLQLSCRAGLKSATIQKIVNFILQKRSFLNTEDAITVIFALLNIDTPIDGYNELMNMAFDNVANNIEELDDKKISHLLRLCYLRNFHHFKFSFAVVELVTSQKFSLRKTYTALSMLYNLDFCHPKIVDHFANVLCLEAENYVKESYSPLNCVEYLTASIYHPTQVDDAARIVYSEETRIENMRVKTPLLYLKFLSCLSTLGHFPSKFLSTALDEAFLYQTCSYSKKMGRLTECDRYLLHLHWSLEIYGERNNFAIPSSILKKVIHTVYQKNVNAEYPLTKFIENGLGGSQFLRSGVFTEDGHVIDHVVAMRSGNYPVSLQNLKSNQHKDKAVQHLLFVEDIIIPEDAKFIAVIVAHEADYYTELELLRSWVHLKTRSLSKKNFGVVVVNYSVWKNLPDREKIPYLMREIKLAIPDDSSLKSNYS